MARAKLGRIEGMKEAREALQELGKTAQRGVGKRALFQTAQDMAAAVRSAAPVSHRASNPTPGSLRGSIKAVKDKTVKGKVQAAVLAEDIAAVPNEFGTSKMAAQPFFRPTVNRIRVPLAEGFATALKTEIDGAVSRAAKRAAKAKG